MRAQTSWLNGAVPFGQSGAKTRNLPELGSLIVRVPLRAYVGKRRLAWGNIIVVFLGLMAIQWFDNLSFNFNPLSFLFGGGVRYGNHTAVRNFALLWGAFAIFER